MEKDERKAIMDKEIDLIQGCISRMAQNSFIIKGWAITLVAVALALLPETFDAKLLCGVSVVVTACFWYLDAFYLKMEKLCRLKYQWVIENRQKSDMYCYDLNPHNKKMWSPKTENEPCILRVMITKTLVPIYGSIIAFSLWMLFHL